MDNGPAPNGQLKKKRGRPPGTRKATIYPVQKQTPLAGEELTANGTHDVSSVAETSSIGTTFVAEHTSTKFTPFSIFLRNALSRDRAEITRVARELEVAENTVYRWINGNSDHPRPIHLKRLPDVLPEYRSQLIDVINQTFGNMLDILPSAQREVHKEIYLHVLELNAANDDDDTRFWQISQLIFDTVLQHLDADQQGMAVTYAKLTPPRKDGIHALREVAMRGHLPWPSSFASKAFLGSTTLAGTAAVTQRMQCWNSSNPNHRTLVEIDDFERSACAMPIMRGSSIAGVLIVSSNQSDFFTDPSAAQAVTEYALLLNIALNSHDFYSSSLLHLRPMPGLEWQREQISQSYAERIITYARKHATSRSDAEMNIQSEMEAEFEKVAHIEIEQRRVLNEQIEHTAH